MKKICRIAFALALIFGASATALQAAAADRIETVAEDCQASPAQGGILLAASSRTQFDIYTITGQCVKSITVEDGTAKAELPKGCYIVRCAKWSKKVVVK